MDPMTIAAVGQAAAGVVQGVTGAIQKAKANKIMRSNKRPTYRIPDSIRANNDIAGSRASQGLSDAGMQAYNSSNDRALTASLDAITKNGGDANAVGNVYDNSLSGIRSMAMMDEQMRAQNIRTFMESNNQLGDYQDKAWQINEYGPYADKAQAAATLSKQGSENIWKGINSVGSAASNYATGKMYEKEGNNVFSVDQARSQANQYTQPPTSSIERSPEQLAIQKMRNQYPGLVYGNLSPAEKAAQAAQYEF